MPELTTNTSLKVFDQGYWYAHEIKDFARKIGVRHVSRLRKDELETIIRGFLKSGKLKTPGRKNIVKTGPKDLDKGLKLSLPVVHYTSNKQTKDFIVTEALKLRPGLKKKPGARYRLNRWREEQITAGKKITYGDLVKKYIELNSFEGEFKKITAGRYINFLADYLKNEKNATHEHARAAWKN
ncbi:MAG TPA: hypothetical protein VD905_03345 [Flavobacteriales bacterium]|nr:hypothetical protein [Flavobacteriales bacterium]